MKKSFILLIFASMMTLGLSAQNIIAAWTFDSLLAKPNTPNVIKANPDLGELPHTATIYLDGTNGSSKFISSSNDDECQLTSNGGSDINDPRTKVNKSYDLALINQTTNGYHAMIKFSTKDFADIVLTMAVRGSASGAKTHVWAYSTTDTGFVKLDCENTANPTSTYELKTVDLSKIEAVNNQEYVYLRLTIDGTTTNNGSTRLDNIVIKGRYTAEDVVAPSLKSVDVTSLTSMTLNFSEPLDSSSTKIENFNILDTTINVTKAILSSENAITLTFDAIKEAAEYQMVIANISDTAKNVMANDTISFSFGVSEEFIVKTIAELKTKIDYTNSSVVDKDVIEYKYVGKAIVTAKTAFRNQKYIQDSTGAILIYDEDAVVKTAVEIGDEVTNVYGKLTNYHGYLEFAPTRNFEFTGSSFNEVTPMEINLTQLLDMKYMSQHQSELVVIKDVTFKDAGSKFVGPSGSNGKKYDITQGSNTDNAIFINIQESDLNNSEIPSGAVNIVGIAVQDNYTVKDSVTGKDVKVNKYYILPRMISDITKVTGIVNNEIKTIAVYPNPTTNYVTVEVEAQNVVAQIFDIYGKLLSTESIDSGYDRIDLSSFSNGLYIIRLSSENNVIATAKVIKR